MSQKLKTIIYITTSELTKLQNGESITIGGKTIDPAHLEDFEIKVVLDVKAIAPIQGVQLADVDLTPDPTTGKVNVPKGSSVVYGVWKVNSSEGIKSTYAGSLQIAKATDAEIAAKTQDYKPIVPANLQKAVDTGVQGSTNYQEFSCEMSDGTTKTLKMYCEII